MAIIAYRPLLVTLPLVGLGFIAMFAGLRFTIYAVPMMAIGFAYLLMWSTQRIEKRWLRNITLAVFTIAAILPNLDHIRGYMTPTVFTNQEVAALSEFKKIASREDYVVTWWDYGYPLRYYSDVKTWVDGGKHSGDVNYPASFVLLAQDSISAAHMMRLYTEYTERGYNDNNKSTNDFEYMLNREGFKDPNDFISALSLPEYKMPPKSRDVYLFLPLRMMDIFPTVSLFSNLDLTGKEKNTSSHFFFLSRSIQDTPQGIELGQGVSIQKTTNSLKMGNQNAPIKAFYQVGYDEKQKLQINRQTFRSDGLTVIFMASYGQFLVVDDYFFNSAFIQMFVLEQYDPTLFQPVILSPMTKIYKLKI
jgi:dolichyl-diphosphooligosaccharide--protein glycosyltransferase/undecaprenyl-diphosphooligosaccharide--protein glycosyltransferase